MSPPFPGQKDQVAWDPAAAGPPLDPSAVYAATKTETAWSTTTAPPIITGTDIWITLPSKFSSPGSGRASMSDMADDSRPSKGYHGKDKGSLQNTITTVALTMGLIFFILFLVLLAVCCWRRKVRKREQRQRETAAAQEMVSTVNRGAHMPPPTPPIDTRAYYQPPTGSPLASVAPSLNSASISPVTTAPTQPRTQHQAPVLLSTNVNQSYFTGIDTSDAMSVMSGPQHTPAIDNSDALSLSEPPPPYRPQSTSFSRENSMRLSQLPPYSEQRQSLRRNPPPIMSPFADPDPDEDEVEDVRQPATIERRPVPVRDMEEMSDVSTLSDAGDHDRVTDRTPLSPIVTNPTTQQR